jgi:nitrite reductase/ring-hydroxylating ferredoxin subunit
MSETLIRVCPTSDVPDGQGVQVAVEDLVLAVFKVNDRYCVIDDACTHGPGSLSEGEVDGDVIECNFHNGAFNIITGEVVAPPCMIPIRTYYTEVRDGQLFIDRDRPADR